MQTTPATLHMLCGKVASGKSTLAARLGSQAGTVTIAEDAWLEALFADELKAVDDYVRCSAKLRGILGPHVAALLGAGVSVVLDFAANTRGQRRWLKEIVEATGALHTLHVLDVSDEVCLARLRARNATGEHPFTVTEAQYHEVTRYFTEPAADEGFTIFHHREGADTRQKAPGS